jgi:hypothetical protein
MSVLYRVFTVTVSGGLEVRATMTRTISDAIVISNIVPVVAIKLALFLPNIVR